MSIRDELIKELQMLEAQAKEISKRRRQVKESLAGVSTSASSLSPKQIKEKILKHQASVRARRSLRIQQQQQRKEEEVKLKEMMRKNRKRKK